MADPELDPKADPEPPPPPPPPPDPNVSAAADKPPSKAKKKPGRPKGSKTKAKATPEPKAPSESAEIRSLRKQLENLLTSPAFAFEAVGEDWPAKHVDRTGKNLAAEIANYAAKNLAFRVRLEAFLEGGETTKLILAAGMYIAPLGIYFGVIPAPDRIRVLMAIPNRQGGLPPVGEDGVPVVVREQAEREAIEHGFVNEDGTPNLDGYIESLRAEA